MKQPTMLDKIKQSGAVSEQHVRLLGFLIDDMALVIDQVDTMKALSVAITPEAKPTERLLNIAQYWEHHLKTLQQ